MEQKPNILQTGVPRSGNFWLYSILEELYSLSGITLGKFISSQHIPSTIHENFYEQSKVDALNCNPRNGQCYWRISSQFKSKIDDLEDYLAAAEHIWTHSPYHRHLNLVLSSRTKIVYIVRDPRDTLVSKSHFQTRKTGISSADFIRKYGQGELRRWRLHTASYLLAASTYDIHFIRYEDLLQNFAAAVHELIRYLELPLGAAATQSLEGNLSFNRMQPASPRHLRRGTSGQWKEDLAKLPVRLNLDELSPVMQYFGYD